MLLNRLIFVHRGGGIRLKSVYVRDIQEGTCMKDSIANILKEHTASVYISDGSNLLGPMIIIDRIISELPVGTVYMQ
ncbi:Cytochrome P450 2L1 [Dirofilaria immitis]